MAARKAKSGKKKPKKSAGKPAKKPAKSRGKSQKKKAAHGTRTRYVNEKCRCPRCRKANADYTRKRQGKVEKKAAATPKGPRLNTAERSLRDSLIVQRRAQNWPWEAVAQEAELTVKATKDAYERKVKSVGPLLELDPTKILEGLIEGLQLSIGDLEQLAVAAVEERNVSAAVSAKKAANETREKLQDLLQTTGILPRNLGTIKHQIEFQVIVVEIVSLVQVFVGRIEKIDLPEDARPEVLEAATELTAGIEQLDGSTPSTNGDSDGREETAEVAPAA